MDDITRDRVREKQDRLLALAESMNLDQDLQITQEWAGSPTLRQLRGLLYPEFEDAIDYAINYLEEQQRG